MPSPIDRARSLIGTGRRYLRNAVRRRTDPQSFIENDRTPHGEIFRDGMLAVRHYPRPAWRSW